MKPNKPSLFLIIAALLWAAVGAAQEKQLPSVVGIVVNEDRNTLAIFDPNRDSIMGLVDFGPAGSPLNKPHLAAFDPLSRSLYVGNKGSNLVVFDMSNVMAPNLVADVKLGGSGEIHRVAMAAGLVWIAHEGDSAVYACHPADFTAPKLTFGKDKGFDTPHGLAMRPGTNELWVTNRPGKAPGFILRIDMNTRSVLGRQLRTTGKAGDRPNNVAFTPDGRWAYVVNTGSDATQVTVIDAARFEVVVQIEQDGQLGRAPHALTFDPVTQRMFVANKDSGTVSAIDVATNTVVAYIPVGVEPHGVSLGPDRQIYAVAKKGNKLTVIEPRMLAVATEISDPALVGPHQIIFTAVRQE